MWGELAPPPAPKTACATARWILVPRRGRGDRAGWSRRLGWGCWDRAGGLVAVDDAEGVAQRRGPEVAGGVRAVGHEGDRIAGADQVGRAVELEGELALDDQQQLP